MQESSVMVEIVSQAEQNALPLTVTHTDALPPGVRLAEFEIQGLLGVGGFGLVYRAYDTTLHRAVAIKEYMPAALAARQDGATVTVRSSGDESAYRFGLQSFIDEACLLAQFDHPSLVKVYRFFETNNTAYMVMPLYRGMTLKQARTLMSAPPPEEWLRTVLWSILQALHVLHRQGALHRDISPDNIFLQDVGPPVLLDLGAARRAITDKSQKLTTILKVNYAPIEQFAEAEDLQQGPWSDLYALAATVYSCLCNDPPLPATARAVRDSLQPVRQVAATVKKHFGLSYSDAFTRTIQHALALRPDARPKNLAAFVTEMKLKVPSRLNKFNWRVELGDSLRPEEEENSRQFLLTQPATLLDPSLAESVDEASQARRRRSWLHWPQRRWVVWAGGLSLLVVMMVLAQTVTRSRPGVVAELPRPNPTPQVVPAVPLPEPASMPEPAAVAESSPVAASVVVPVVAESAPRAAAPAKSAPTKNAVAPNASERKPSARAARPVAEPRPVEPVAAPPEEPVVVSKELCASANFFTKSMCMYQECKKAENAQLPVCVEVLQRYQDKGP